MIVIQNDIKASERSAAELNDRLLDEQQFSMDKIDLEQLARNVIAIGNKLLDASDLVSKQQIKPAEVSRFDTEWTASMLALEKLADHVLQLIQRFETNATLQSIVGKADLVKSRRQYQLINMFPLADIRKGLDDVREGRLTPLSAIKDAL